MSNTQNDNENQIDQPSAPRLDRCKDLAKRLGITRPLASALARRFPTLVLTPRTERALKAAVALGETLDTVNDVELLRALLQDITDGRFGAPDAETLIAEFGDVLRVVTAGVHTGLTHGECMRLNAAAMLCLRGGARGLKIPDDKIAAYYLGKVYRAGQPHKNVAAYLDGEFRTLAIEPDTNIAKRAAALGANYVIVAQYDDGEMFDVKSAAEKLKTELKQKNALLLDWLVFDDGDGYAAFAVGSALPDAAVRFEYYDY